MFDEVIKDFPSRENYNNAGVAKLLAALQLKAGKMVEFIYPIELDGISRLQGASRDGVVEDKVRITTYLHKARQNFETAIRLDPAYFKAYINLACVMDVLDNWDGAVGVLKDLLTKAPVTTQQTIKINLIKGIASFHAGETAKADGYFNMLAFGMDSIIDYNIRMYQLKARPLEFALFADDWKKRNKQINGIISDSLKNYFERSVQQTKHCTNVSGDTIKICRNGNNTAIEITIKNNKRYKAVSFINANNITELTKENQYWLINIKGQNKSWIIKEL